MATYKYPASGGSVLPTGASTSSLQTAGNTSLASIDTKTPALVSGAVPVSLPTSQITTLTPLSSVAVNNFPAVQTIQPLAAIVASGSVTSAATLFTQDCASYQSTSVHVTALPAGNVITFQTSNDNINWYNCACMPGGDLTSILATTATAAGAYTSQLNSRYFRAIVTTYTSGTVAATAYFKNFGNSPNSIGGYVSALTLDGSGNGITSTAGALNVNFASGATSALQTTGNTSLATIATNTTGASTAALQTSGNASLTTIATNSGTQATSALQTSGNASLTTIATNSGTQATAANQTSGNSSLTSVATNTNVGTNGAATSALQTSGNTTLSSILTACQASTPAGSAVIGAVTQSGNWTTRTADGIGNLVGSVTTGSQISLNTRTTGRSILTGAPIRNDYTSTSVTTAAYVQLIANTPTAVNEISIFDSSGQTLALATGAAGLEVIQLYIFPGGNGREPLFIPGGTRVSVKAVSANATVGELDINFYQ